MFPSSTVENYIKVIHAQQVRLSDPDGLVPMGHLAMGMGVTPGTATTMVKALADSGLVHYAPYAGVRLTRAGERLAGMVIRRHRLIELFLVQVMGLKWDEVHEEAEQLEHVVSERLIQRMDEMLGGPEVDPHGDPIPDAHGTFPQRELHTLLTCPLHVPVTVMRVADQDASFLRFVESNQLKPGQELSVDARDEVADSVSVRATGGTVRARHVVVAADGALPALVPGLRDRVRARRLHMVATEPLPDRLVDCPVYARWGYEYFQQLPDGRLLAGGFSDLDGDHSYTDRDEGNRDVWDRIERYLAQDLGVRAPIGHRWVGTVGYTKDGRPMVGVAAGVYYAGGYSGHGNVIGYLAGQQLAELVTR